MKRPPDLEALRALARSLGCHYQDVDEVAQDLAVRLLSGDLRPKDLAQAAKATAARLWRERRYGAVSLERPANRADPEGPTEADLLEAPGLILLRGRPRGQKPCPGCGKYIPSGRQACSEVCGARDRAARARAQGRCQKCRAPARPGTTLCARHRASVRTPAGKARLAAYHRDRARRLARERAADGLCTFCGRSPPRPGYAYCEPCRQRNLLAVHAYHERRKHGNTRDPSAGSGPGPNPGACGLP